MIKFINMNGDTSGNMGSNLYIKTFKFPDGQVHVNLSRIDEDDEITVHCSITDSEKMIQLLEISDALDNLHAKKKVLLIPYLMGARYDRYMIEGDSFDLRVFAKLINSCNFEKVYLYDVHSDVAPALINNSKNITNLSLVRLYKQENAILICPDAGAGKRVESYLENRFNLKDVVYCIKHRDVSSGKLTLQVLNPEKCEDRNCIIIDDICDGGATFLAIAKQIKPKHLTLMVTHVIFSKGFSELEKYFQEIIVSNSYRESYDNKIVKVYGNLITQEGV